MDKVRLGRALGYGARHAAKTFAAVAEAATAPDPRQPQAPAQPAASPTMHKATRPAAQGATPAATPRTRPQVAARTPTPGLGRSLWRPMVAFSSVVGLQVAGTFFALVALSFTVALWRRWTEAPGYLAHAGGQLWFLLGVIAVFAYFAASSFWRAHRRGRSG